MILLSDIEKLMFSGYIPFVDLPCERFIGESITWIIFLSTSAPIICQKIPWLCCPLEVSERCALIRWYRYQPISAQGSFCLSSRLYKIQTICPTRFWRLRHRSTILGRVFEISKVIFYLLPYSFLAYLRFKLGLAFITSWYLPNRK